MGNDLMLSAWPDAVSLDRASLPRQITMKFQTLFCIACCSWLLGSTVLAQRSIKKHKRATPPEFKPNEFSGVFFSDALSQLLGEIPTVQLANADVGKPDKSGAIAPTETSSSTSASTIWKELVSSATIEDIVKESKTRLDGIITTPAKFSGGVVDVRREFTLLASAMAVIAQYPEQIRWQSSAIYAQRIFARMAANCKVGTLPVFNEAKQRQQDLQNLLKGSKVTGAADEVSWSDTADRGPSMQIMEWALRENLAKSTNNEKRFRESQEEVVKYAELLAMFGNIIKQPGMTDADDQEYVQFATAMVQAAQEVVRAARINDAELARTAVGRIDQACIKCHETYR